MIAEMIPSATIVRTERGLVIAGTRITLYDIIEFLQAEWPHKLIRDYFALTDAQIDAALNYIYEHRADVELEYRQLIQQAEEIRQYWDERNRERIAMVAKLPTKPGMEAAWAQLQTAKAKRKLTSAHPH